MTKLNTSLTIDSKIFSKRHLIDFCLSGLSAAPAGSPEYSLYDFILKWISDETVLMVKTSGSTGEPKEIVVSKQAMAESAKLTGRFLGLKKDDKVLLCLPAEFIAGKMMVVRAFVLGLNLVPLSPAANPLKNIDRSFGFAAMTPMQVHNILENAHGYEKLNKIENLIIGGGDIGKSLLEKIRKLQNKTFHTYGMTETITHVALKRLNGDNPDTHFKALENITLGKDERGCLIINAPHISNEKIKTNDIVELKSDTEFTFTGRFDNVINTGGIKVFPEAIEKKLSDIISERFIVSALPDEKLSEKVVLIIEGNRKRDYGTAISNSTLSKYEKPKDIFFIDKFPETAGGKIDRKKVRPV